MSDSKLYKTSCMLLDFLSLVRDGLFIENDFTKNFPINSNEFQAKICSISMPPSHINVILYLAKVKSSPISHIAKKLNISKSNSLSQVKVGNDFIYFLSIILQSISIVALPKFDH